MRTTGNIGDGPSPNAKYAYGRLGEAIFPFREDAFVFDLENWAVISRKPRGQSIVIQAQQLPSDATRQHTNATPMNCRGVGTTNKAEGGRK